MPAAQRQKEQAIGAINAPLLHDVLRFFSGERGGYVDGYGYSSSLSSDDPVCGGALWNSFIETHADYYPYRDEPLLIAEHAEEIASACRGTRTFVELGVGSIRAFEIKTLPLLQAMKPISYIAADINHDYAEGVLALLNKREPSIRADFRICDFFLCPPAQKEKSLFYLVGATISNIEADLRRTTPSQALTRSLRRFACAIPQGGHFVFTFDANHDEASVRRAYNHPLMAALNENFIELIKRDLPTRGLRANDFKHAMFWDDKARLLTHELVPQRDVSFSIAERRFDLPAGARLHATNCFKFSEETVERSSALAGFKTTRIHALKGSPLRLAILKK